jgi:hypothetical protein
MLKLEIFDPPMCCATGICGNNVDPKLITFASDLEWLKKQGVDVVRYGLSFEPNEFVKNEDVKITLQKEGNDSLPIVIADNKLVYKGIYPNREQLARTCNIAWKDEFATEETQKIEAEVCGSDCECHKSALSNTAKKVLFILIVLAMLAIIAFKMSPKAHSAEIAYPSISSFSQIKPSQEVTFVCVPEKNGQINNKTKSAILSAKKSLEAKNIKVDLYILNPSSADYSSQTVPSVVVIYKGKDKKIVTGDINTTKLLQAYIATTLSGGCGAGCPCHKH